VHLKQPFVVITLGAPQPNEIIGPSDEVMEQPVTPLTSTVVDEGSGSSCVNCYDVTALATDGRYNKAGSVLPCAETGV